MQNTPIPSISVIPSQKIIETPTATLSALPTTIQDPRLTASPSGIQTNNIQINPCPSGTQFEVLCKLKVNQMGQSISIIVSILISIAVLLSLFSLLWGSIQWIISGGDKTRVTAARNAIFSSIIGLVIVFLAYFILSIILNSFGLSLAKLTLPTLPLTGK